MVFYMKFLFSPGIVLIKGSRPFPKASKHDAWPTHGKNVGWVNYSVCVSGNAVLALVCQLVNGDGNPDDYFYYPFTPPMNADDATLLQEAIMSFAQPGQPQTQLGEQFNYFYRPQIYGKFTPDGWDGFLESH